MIKEGQIALFHFPYSNQSSGKLRPALVIRKLPGPFEDWLICMISTQLSQKVEGIDEFIRSEDQDFNESGLKAPSIFRVSRLAVVEQSILLGVIGEISFERLSLIKSSLSNWIKG